MGGGGGGNGSSENDGKRSRGPPNVSGGADADRDQATTTMMTDTEEMGLGSDAESEDGEDFAAENAPRPPPDTIMYGGDGESNATGRDVNQVSDRGGQIKTGSAQRPARQTGASCENHGGVGIGESEDAQRPTRA